MNDHDLQQKLRALAVPVPDDTARERARHRALLVFSQGGPEAPERRPSVLRWAVAGTAALALAAVFWIAREAEPAHQSGPGEAAVLAQVEALFPGQLDAVIEHEDGEMRVALAAQRQPASDQPLLVEFRRGDSLVRVLSYSGRHVCVDLGGRHACFDALIDNHGKVIVAGEDFLWTERNRASAGGWQITAAPLGGAS
jgi:hypothetical protein